MMVTYEEFERQFPTDNACKAYIVAKRWPDGVRCPRCQSSEKIYQRKGQSYRWICCNKGCGERRGYGFSVTTATIFQDTKVSLKIWFKIGYLMLTAKKGISSLQVRRVIFGEDSGTDWRTAWYICHRWRAAMHGDAFPLTGEVEVDETYIGGKDKTRHWNKRTAQVRKSHSKRVKGQNDPTISYGKVGVVGAIERKGNVGCPRHRRYGRSHAQIVRKPHCERARDPARDRRASGLHLRRSAQDERPSRRHPQQGRIRARRGSHSEYRIVLIADKTRRCGHFSQREQGLSAPVPE